MQPALLPLFPLNVVLFPRTPLPLHIFEDRYKQMISDVLMAEGEFGVVLASQGGIMNTGCTAVVGKVLKRYPDGRMDLIALGRRRFEILAVDQQLPYLRGEIQFFDDEDDEETESSLLERTVLAYNSHASASKETLIEPDWKDTQLSFQLAQVVDDLNLRQVLLATRSEPERMRQLAGFFERRGEARPEIARLQKVAALNGHGRHISQA